MLRISDLLSTDTGAIRQTAQLLVEGFADTGATAWPDFDAALAEVFESLAPSRLSRIARVDGEVVAGWIGGQPLYDGRVWEMHPLVVLPRYRRQGLGRALVADFEVQVRARGGHTVYLGTDDEDQRTTLGGVDLYPNVLEHLARLESRRDHPFVFYQKLGYAVVGALPDANGPGKPDLFMAKRV